MPMKLSEIQIDYIKELFNVGLGEAVVEINDLINEEVLMSVPDFEIFDTELIYEKLEIEKQNDISAVIIPITGDITCYGILLFPAESSLELVRRVLNDSGRTSSLTHLEVESLTEVSSIILDAIINSIGEILSMDLSTELPTAYTGDFEHLVATFYSQATVMSVGMYFEIKNSDVRGDILFIQDINVVKDFIERTNQMLKELGL